MVCPITYGDHNNFSMNIHEAVLQPIAAFVYCNRQAAAFRARWRSTCSSSRSGLSQGVPILYNGPPLHPPSKLHLPMGDVDPPSNTRFPEPTRVLNPNGISIGWAGFYRAHYCNRPTDRATRSVTIGRIYVHTGTLCSKKVDHQTHGGNFVKS